MKPTSPALNRKRDSLNFVCDQLDVNNFTIFIVTTLHRVQYFEETEA